MRMLTVAARRIVLALFLSVAPCLLAREVPITILHTCDLHGNVLPTENYEGQTNLGGIARCAIVIRQVRASERNVLLVDAGDTIQGAAVSYLADGQVMVKALNELRYDAWVWGNHEFDWGLEKLAACAERAQMPILNANLQAASSNSAVTGAAARILARRQAYVLREVDGVKVGVIGLNTPGIPNWSRPRLIEGLKFVDSVETLRTVVPALRRAGAQILVLVCHQGYREGGDDRANQVNAIARNFPELDVVIGGHSHRDFPEFKVGNVLYCQADYFGIRLGRVDLVFDTAKGRVTRRSSNTMLMDDRVPLDGELVKSLGKELDQAQKTLSTVIGEARGNFELQGAPRRETPIHDLVFEAIAEALQNRGVEIDAIVHGILEQRGMIGKGAITIGDIWKVVPYENTIGVLQLTTAQLKEILEENASAYERREFRGVWGVRCTFDPRGREGMRIVSLQRADGTPLEGNRKLAVAFNSYDLASGGLRWKRLREIADSPGAELVEYDFQTRQAVIDYVRKHGEISPSVKGWWKTAQRSAASSAAAASGR